MCARSRPDRTAPLTGACTFVTLRAHRLMWARQSPQPLPPAMIHAAVIPAPHQPVEIREFPEPDIAPGGMLLRTEYSEVCGTDVHLWHGRLSGVPYPLIPGHVSIGFAEKIRGEVIGGDQQRLKEGDRVVFFDVHRTCGRCYACAVTHTPTKCPSRKVYGITDGAHDGLFGGWSEAI